MIKDFEIKDILNAVNSISKINKKKGRATDLQSNLNNKKNVLTLNNGVKLGENKVLVLDEMVE